MRLRPVNFQVSFDRLHDVVDQFLQKVGSVNVVIVRSDCVVESQFFAQQAEVSRSLIRFFHVLPNLDLIRQQLLQQFQAQVRRWIDWLTAVTFLKPREKVTGSKTLNDDQACPKRSLPNLTTLKTKPLVFFLNPTPHFSAAERRNVQRRRGK